MKTCRQWAKDIGLGVGLIVAASAILLWSDLDRRQQAIARHRGELPRLAILQWASTSLLDDTVAGIVKGLQDEGFVNGESAVIRFYNASGDLATGSMMARELTSGRYDMVLTASTLALQAVAAANREGRVVHVFGGVTDPYGAGVGITGPEPDQHPPHLVGVGTFQPVERAILMAREMNPDLRRVGVVWNPAEDNSEACVLIARRVCEELGIALVEANAGSTSEVPEAIRSVLTRGVDAVWIGGDVVAIASIHAILAAAQAEGVPVFTNDPGDAAHGALFGLGASYQQVGYAVGSMGGQILRGADPMSFGVENVVPEVLALREDVVQRYPNWSFPEELLAFAAASQSRIAARRERPRAGRTYRVGVLYVGPHPVFETGLQGVREGLAEFGFEEGVNLVVEEMHPNDDFSIFPQVARRLRDRHPDVIIPLSTPALVAALGGDDRIPIVFGIVSAPLEAGAGTSFDDHLPHVTGAVWTAPSPESFAWMRELFPRTQRIGTVYNPSHANSLVQVQLMRELSRGQGWELIERSISTPADITTVMQSLLTTDPDIVYAMAENTVVSAFAAVVQSCRQAGIPLVATDNSLMGSGALFSVGGSPLLEGRNTGRLAARVLLGENPAGIPFSPSTEQETAVDFAAARHLDMAFPIAFLKEVDQFHHLHEVRGRPLRVWVVSGSGAVEARALRMELEHGLRRSALVEARDFDVVHDAMDLATMNREEFRQAVIERGVDAVVADHDIGHDVLLADGREVSFWYVDRSAAASDPLSLAREIVRRFVGVPATLRRAS